MTDVVKASIRFVTAIWIPTELKATYFVILVSQSGLVSKKFASQEELFITCARNHKRVDQF